MEPSPNIEFDDAVVRFFMPVADSAILPFTNLGSGVYEIRSRSFAMRIRKGTGHRKDFVVTLALNEDLSADPYDLQGEIGLGVFAQFRGQRLEIDDRSEEAFRNAAQASQDLLLPYLLDERSDFHEVRNYLDRRHSN